MPALHETSRALIRAARADGDPSDADRSRVGDAIERLLAGGLDRPRGERS